MANKDDIIKTIGRSTPVKTKDLPFENEAIKISLKNDAIKAVYSYQNGNDYYHSQEFYKEPTQIYKKRKYYKGVS